MCKEGCRVQPFGSRCGMQEVFRGLATPCNQRSQLSINCLYTLNGTGDGNLSTTTNYYSPNPKYPIIGNLDPLGMSVKLKVQTSCPLC